MIIKNKCLQCFFNYFNNKIQIVCILLVVFIIILCSHLGEVLNNFLLDKNDKIYCGEPIDLVYTWVNGSDEKFRENLKNFLDTNNFNHNSYSDERFDDKYELKFSLRSLEKYAPWINHVFIVTNGQIPYWLNLDYEKVSIITHEEIFENLSNLPTFSSPAIEKNIHKIPGLSKHFIYVNDDIFFGAPIYPDDFLTKSRGYMVYLSWPLPSCKQHCPWIYVGDGQCDSSCFYDNCQYDGGDCTQNNNNNNGAVKKLHEFGAHHEDEFNKQPIDYEYFDEADAAAAAAVVVKRSLTVVEKNITSINNNNKISSFKHKINNKTSNNLKNLVDTHNKKLILNDKLNRKKRLYKTIHQRKKFYNLTNNFNHNTQNISNKVLNLDTFALSLQNTHKIFNVAYGFKARKVPAHAPILINIDIMKSLQGKFKKEFVQTEQNRLRSPYDMQYSFSYYYYLINEKIRNNITEIFERFDTDDSNTWSDREIRTVLTKLNELPLNYAMVEKFDNAIINCSKFAKQTVTSPPFERYLDSKLPLVTKKLILNCPTIINMLYEHFGVDDKFKYEIIKNSLSNYVIFKMLTSNVSDVVGHLDEIRKEPRKFVCLNDNMVPKKHEENELVKAILLDFYISLFPKPSKFELNHEFRNRFSYVSDLNEWKMYHNNLKIFYIICILILLLIIFYNVCKRRIMRQIKNIIYCYFMFLFFNVLFIVILLN